MRSFHLLLIGIKAIDSKINLGGPAGTMFHTKQRFVINLEVNGSTYMIYISRYIQSQIQILCNFIIGKLLFQTNAEFRSKSGSSENQYELDVGSKEHFSILSKMVFNYTPHKTTPMRTKIIVGDEQLVYQRPERLSLNEKIIVEKQIEEWIKSGIVRTSCSDYASPILIFKKKDNTSRICINYRWLNSKIIKDTHYL